jgi:hypothetical protein
MADQWRAGELALALDDFAKKVRPPLRGRGVGVNLAFVTLACRRII